MATALGVVFLFINVPLFLEHWETWTKEHHNSQNVLLSDLCSKPDVMASVGDAKRVCDEARTRLSVPPVIRALFSTLGEWNVCRNQWCMLTLLALFNNMYTWGLIVAGLFAVRWFISSMYSTPGNVLPYGTTPIILTQGAPTHKKLKITNGEKFD